MRARNQTPAPRAQETTPHGAQWSPQAASAPSPRPTGDPTAEGALSVEMIHDPHAQPDGQPAVRLSFPPGTPGHLILERSQLARTVEQLAGVLWELNAAPLAPGQDYPEGEAA